jgi:hypothetical protein
MNATLEHIDEQRLETDLGYRFDYVSRFMGFGEEDIALIHEAGAYLAPLVPGLVDAVYDKLFQFDATKRHFMPRQHGFDGALPLSVEEMSQHDEQIAFRKQHLGRYLTKLVTTPYDGKMVQYLDWVGKIHTEKAGNEEIVVPMVQCTALFGFVNDALLATISGLPLPESRRWLMGRAFTKLMWLQSDLFVRHYL